MSHALVQDSTIIMKTTTRIYKKIYIYNDYAIKSNITLPWGPCGPSGPEKYIRTTLIIMTKEQYKRLRFKKTTCIIKINMIKKKLLKKLNISHH